MKAFCIQDVISENLLKIRYTPVVLLDGVKDGRSRRLGTTVDVVTVVSV
jgi:hypothetical protein